MFQLALEIGVAVTLLIIFLDLSTFFQVFKIKKTVLNNTNTKKL